jgi:hypothetical protein
LIDFRINYSWDYWLRLIYRYKGNQDIYPLKACNNKRLLNFSISEEEYWIKLLKKYDCHNWNLVHRLLMRLISAKFLLKIYLFIINFNFVLKLHKSIESLDKKNESLRQNIKDLYELIAEYQEIKVMIFQ